jgi:peptidoglycan/LPS O-acetylase OafA/YrhL
VLALGFASLLAWSLKAGSVARWCFERASLRFFGKYSYGLYVFHVLVLTMLQIPLWTYLAGVLHSKAVADGAAGLLCLGLSVVIAVASYQLYEKRFLRLKHLFDYTRVEPARVQSIP